MAKFWVWDPDNESAEHARLIDAPDAAIAAERYAEDDHDSVSEGLYSVPGHDLSVKSDSGELLKVRVSVEYTPEFTQKSYDRRNQTKLKSSPCWQRGTSVALRAVPRKLRYSSRLWSSP